MFAFLSVAISAGSIYTLWDNAVFWRFITIPLTLAAIPTAVALNRHIRRNKQHKIPAWPPYRPKSILGEASDLLWLLNDVLFFVGFCLLVAGFLL